MELYQSHDIRKPGAYELILNADEQAVVSEAFAHKIENLVLAREHKALDSLKPEFAVLGISVVEPNAPEKRMFAWIHELDLLKTTLLEYQAKEDASSSGCTRAADFVSQLGTKLATVAMNNKQDAEPHVAFAGIPSRFGQMADA